MLESFDFYAQNKQNIWSNSSYTTSSWTSGNGKEIICNEIIQKWVLRGQRERERTNMVIIVCIIRQ